MAIDVGSTDRPYLEHLLGKTIRGVLLASDSDQPRGQVFLLFDDAHFEFYSGQPIRPIKGLWPAKGANVRIQVGRSIRPTSLTVEAHLPDSAGTASVGSSPSEQTPSIWTRPLALKPPRPPALLRLLAGLFLMASLAFLLYPPWMYTYTQPGMAVVHTPGPHHLLFLPPPPKADYEFYGVVLDFGRLAIEMLLFMGLAATTFGCSRALTHRHPRSDA